MPRRPLLATLVALMLSVSGAEGGSATEDVAPPAFSVLSNATLTCSAQLPSTVVGCFVERPIATLGPVELAIGLDAQATLRGVVEGHLAAYLVAAVYLDSWSAWVEVFTPEFVPPLGSPDWLRAGFSYRFD